MPRIVRFHTIGGPEVLKLEELDLPMPRPDEVQIKIKALGLNRAEALFRAGNYLEKAELPSRLGYEASGIIESVGSEVKDFAPGDIVSIVPPLGQGKYGVYGELANVPVKYVVKHPSILGFEEAAAVWMQYMTAYGALIEIAKIKKGDFVAIPAASSSVGLAAIQLCNMVEAVPIALTRKNSKRRALEIAGAPYVIATEEEDLVVKLNEITHNRGVPVVFDPVGGKTVLSLAKAMAYQGILFQYGALSSEPTPFPVGAALSKGLTMRGYTLFEIVNDPDRFERAKLFIINGLILQQLKPIIAKVFPLEEIVEAHHYLESNLQFGKIIVTVK